jgi:hypothetical protein
VVGGPGDAVGSGGRSTMNAICVGLDCVAHRRWQSHNRKSSVTGCRRSHLVRPLRSDVVEHQKTTTSMNGLAVAKQKASGIGSSGRPWYAKRKAPTKHAGSKSRQTTAQAMRITRGRWAICQVSRVWEIGEPCTGTSLRDSFALTNFKTVHPPTRRTMHPRFKLLGVLFRYQVQKSITSFAS